MTPVDPLAALAADFARPMTSIRGRRVQRLIKREFAGAEAVSLVRLGTGRAAVLGLSALGAALCATDGTGKEASVLKWLHGASVVCDVRFDLLKDSLPLLSEQDLPLAHLRALGPLQAAADTVPAPARPMLAKVVALLR